MEKPLVSVIIVNFNGAEYIERCLTVFKKFTPTSYDLEIVFVDNASSDNSIEVLHAVIATSNLSVNLIKSPTNTGFALGNNIGIEKANGKYLLFLNTDTEAQEDFLDPLVKRLESDPNIAAVQPAIFMKDRSNVIDSIGSYFISSGFLYHPGHNKESQKRHMFASKVFSMKGACMLFRKDVIDKLGALNPNFFAYFEETDLCIRTLIAGYEIWFEPSAKIYHKGGGTSQKFSSEFVLFHSYKNRIFCYITNFEISTLIRLLPIHIFLNCVVALGYLLILKPRLTKAILAGFFWNLSNIPLIKKTRSEIQSHRKIHDNDYLPLLTRRVNISYYFHLFFTSLAGYKDEI